MTKRTLTKIHQEYVAAVLVSKDILSITKNFYERLNVINIPEEDHKQFDLFLDGVRGCIHYRERTNEFTSLVQGLTTTIVYIMIFMNNRKDKNWDVNIIARRKALERDLNKLLRKATELQSTSIRDRFGVRIVQLNDKDFSTEESYVELHNIFDAVQGILCGTNRKLRNEFTEFVAEIKNPLIKPQIDTILALPLISDFLKDYILEPKKDSGYQSLHFCLRVDYYSEYFAGAEVEIQIRSQEMDENATIGKYRHDVYEIKTSGDVKEIFRIPDELFKDLKISGFTSYVAGVGDIDGIGSAKLLVNRRVSSSLIPIYKQEALL